MEKTTFDALTSDQPSDDVRRLALHGLPVWVSESEHEFSGDKPFDHAKCNGRYENRALLSPPAMVTWAFVLLMFVFVDVWWF